MIWQLRDFIAQELRTYVLALNAIYRFTYGFQLIHPQKIHFLYFFGCGFTNMVLQLRSWVKEVGLKKFLACIRQIMQGINENVDN